MKNSQVNIGLSNPKTPANVDSIMRSAGNYRVDAVYYTGERYDRAVKFNTNTANISRKVSLNIPLIPSTCLIESTPADSSIICIELAEGASLLPEFIHPENAMYIFGPEDGSIEQSLIDRADAVLYIPTRGCMNLAATVNVVLYDRLAKSTSGIENNELIRQSRDTNNNIKVKLK